MPCSTHLTSRPLYKRTSYTSIKTHLAPTWSVRPRHLCRLLCVAVIMPLPQLKTDSRAIVCIVYLLLLRARTRISRRDLTDVGNRRLYCCLFGVVGQRGHCPPSQGTQTEKLYGRDTPRLIRIIRLHPRASLFLLVSPTVGVSVPFHDFEDTPFLGQEQAVKERSPSENVIESCRLQPPLTLGASARKATFPLSNRSRQSSCPSWQEEPLGNGQSGHSYRPIFQTPCCSA